MSTSPTSVGDGLRHILDRGPPADVDCDRVGQWPDLARGLLRLVDQQVGDDHTRAFFDITLGDGSADAAGASGDKGELVL